jgi:hypothetical protein
LSFGRSRPVFLSLSAFFWQHGPANRKLFQNFFLVVSPRFCLFDTKNPRKKKSVSASATKILSFLHQQGISKFNNTFYFIFIYLSLISFKSPLAKKWIFRFRKKSLVAVAKLPSLERKSSCLPEIMEQKNAFWHGFV